MHIEVARITQAKSSGKSAANVLRTSEATSDFAAGMARVRREDFTTTFDYGTATDHAKKKGSEEAIILYTPKALPSANTGSFQYNDGEATPLIDAKAATANCDVLNVVTLNARGSNVCTAVFSDYESFHVGRWMRIPEKLERKRESQLDNALPFRHVGRGVQKNALDSFPAPRFRFQKDSMDLLKTYFSSLDSVLEELRPIARRVAKDNTIIVQVCNKGQSDLLMNFACSAKAQGLDTSNILVFATDKHTYDVALAMGFSAFFDEKNFGGLPEQESKTYGDPTFMKMMYAKVVPVQLLNMMGYDVLFQDVDVVWMKNPIGIFHDKSSPLHDFDILFQDDGARSVRFAPYSGNTGMYYVRHNTRTRFLLTQLLYNGDMIMETKSHQQALTALLEEHSSLTGLKVKTLEGNDFPSGYHYHRDSQLMKRIVSGQQKPFLFHMCWTKNKENKILFYKQMGMWYMEDKCTGTEALSKMASKDAPACCTAEPLVSCHYKDKPSIIPCKDSDPIDKGRPSFW